ncbi:hypothetical protein ACFLYT_00975 [Nanoarchaeota archaeon]
MFNSGEIRVDRLTHPNIVEFQGKNSKLIQDFCYQHNGNEIYDFVTNLMKGSNVGLDGTLIQRWQNMSKGSLKPRGEGTHASTRVSWFGNGLEFIYRHKDGIVPVIERGGGGLVNIEYVTPEAVPPRVIIHEEYTLCSVHGSLGLGPLVKMIDLAPLEETRLVTKVSRERESSTSQTNSLFHSRTTTSESELEDIMQVDSHEKLSAQDNLKLSTSVSAAWKMVKLSGSAESETRELRETFNKQMQRSVQRYSDSRTQTIEMRIERETETIERTGTEDIRERLIVNHNPDYALHFRCKQVLQQYHLFLCLTGVRLGVFDSDGSYHTYDVSNTGELVSKYIKDSHQSQVSEAINGYLRQYGTVKGYDGEDRRFLVEDGDSMTIPSEESNVSLPPVDGDEGNRTVSVQGIPIYKQDLTLGTNEIFLEPIVGERSALGDFGRSAQEEKKKYLGLVNQLLEEGLAKANSANDEQAAAIYQSLAQVVKSLNTPTAK